MKPDNTQVRIGTLVAEFHAYNAEIANTQNSQGTGTWPGGSHGWSASCER